jgi:hypothetical protein
MDDELPWNHSEPPAQPDRTAHTPIWGVIALVAAAITFLIESWLWLGGLQAQHQLGFLAPAVLMTVALCIVAGASGARAHGLIGGLLILLPGLGLIVVMLIAGIGNLVAS